MLSHDDLVTWTPEITYNTHPIGCCMLWALFYDPSGFCTHYLYRLGSHQSDCSFADGILNAYRFCCHQAIKYNLNQYFPNKANMGFHSCDRPSNHKLDSNRQFSTRVTPKFDGWSRKTKGHFFYTKPSFVNHLKSISEFKLELQSGNAQLGSKLIFCPMWPWNFMDEVGKRYGTSSMLHQVLCIISIPSVKSNLSYSQKCWFFCPSWPWNLIYDLEKQ